MTSKVEKIRIENMQLKEENEVLADYFDNLVEQMQTEHNVQAKPH